MRACNLFRCRALSLQKDRNDRMTPEFTYKFILKKKTLFFPNFIKGKYLYWISGVIWHFRNFFGSPSIGTLKYRGLKKSKISILIFWVKFVPMARNQKETSYNWSLMSLRILYFIFTFICQFFRLFSPEKFNRDFFLI